jgi:replicative DNA helicase
MTNQLEQALVRGRPAYDGIHEQQVLGMMLMNRTWLERGLVELDATDFMEPRYGAILNLLRDLVRKVAFEDWPVEQAVLDALAAKPIEGVDLEYLRQTCDTFAATGAMRYYMTRLKDLARLRNLESLGCKLVVAAREPNADPVLVAAECTTALSNAIRSIARDDGATVACAENLLVKRESKGFCLGFECLDKLIGQIEYGNFCIFAGRPGTGKTAFATQVALKLAITHSLPVAYLSMEMSKERLLNRMAAQWAGVPLANIRHRNYCVDEIGSQKERVQDFVAAMKTAPLRLFYLPGAGIPQISSIVRALAASDEYRIAFVDYIQKCPTPGNAESRHVGVAANVRDLCALAGQTCIAIIACSQMRRETDRTKTIELDLLSETQALEQEADIVLMLTKEREAGEATFTIAKNRDGETGQRTLGWQGAYVRFVEKLQAVGGSPHSGLIRDGAERYLEQVDDVGPNLEGVA